MIPRIIVLFAILLVAITAVYLPNLNIRQQLEANNVSISEDDNLKPVKSPKFQNAPSVSAGSVVIIDSVTGVVLFEKNPDLRLLPASTTKMMTALVALEKCSPEDIVTVKRVENNGTQMGLELQDKITVENLLYGLLLTSGNDAAYVLADACASNYKDFVDKMNLKAKELSMTNSHFVNPAGFDDNLHYSTARDLAKLAKVVVTNPLVARIVATKSTVVTDVSGNRTYFLENVNKLLGTVNGVEGVKTGHTDGALEILVTKTSRNGKSIIVALMGSQDRFKESQMLIDWSFANYTWPKD